MIILRRRKNVKMTIFLVNKSDIYYETNGEKNVKVTLISIFLWVNK